ncbi:1-acyl-sn-glycerol-3-phosphate acyltransferase [Chondrus crispus]|uniref:1-acyl-sn-glycerol-3-phosphate acyltransferase n=1 Tax=Chondrus crispus TaxID=2769 RepID=R7Q1E8_CHOCR|nr:1-acyl-sn-glycerol-3-phosphate acyltransferase [Chondrus crispus]CDF32427.1 1-acyl-sn-glycerol-3-phosphate acyltransferase [Chondrus crispus]|eukprot:XP_005712092.1 1-acyl-sn-glycerol-3-phosphate acyltransferase [Chondrus crispus]
MALAHPFVMWRDKATRRFHDFIAMAWMKCSFGSVLVHPNIVNAHNLPPKGTPVVYVANHSSYLDIFSFAYLRRRIKYVSKAEIFKLPIVGWAMEMAGNIALRRMNRRGQMEAYRKMVAVVKNGLSLVIFPEGTRSASGKMRKFQSGGFRAAKKQNAPIVPVTILGTREVMPAHAWVPLRYPTKPISLVVHPPLDTANRSVHELQDCAYEAIDSALPPEAQTRPLIKHAKNARRNF